MKIARIEIFNFRKLRRARLDMSDKQTLLVGANNSGKTSAMKALRKFLKDRDGVDTRDVTASNWTAIEQIAGAWTQEAEPDLSLLQDQLPFLDVWLHAKTSELHHVAHLIPTLTWTGGLLGVRLRLEPKKGADIKADYLAARQDAEALQPAGATANGFALWPRDFREFLDKRLKDLFELNSHLLDPASYTASGAVAPPPLPPLSEGIGPNPFAGLLHIREINAQRGFADAGDGKGDDGELVHAASRKIASQIEPYFRKHIDPETNPTPNDVKALEAIHDAETTFNARLKDGFANAIAELEGLGYPGGLNNPKLFIATQIKPIDGIDHPAAVQYDISGDTSGVKLPESYNGLGFQNLISMVFQLMRFRDDWMQVGKFKSQVATPEDKGIEPLQLVLVEEPEAHLHVQVQQVFMARAHKVLRNHTDLEKEDSAFTTQLVVSTHSGHIAHAAVFEELRYFKRELPSHGVVPTATVANMTGLFGEDTETRRFVTRYLLSTHFDLFFADAIIVIEGAAERILLPHLIQHHYPDLAVAYLSFLQLGGSHSHRMRPLVEALEVPTLIITDLDAATKINKKTKKGESNSWESARPRSGGAQETTNHALKTWLPEIAEVDKLMVAPPNKLCHTDATQTIAVSYQTPQEVTQGTQTQTITPSTFEDALVLTNPKAVEDAAKADLACLMTRDFCKYIADASTPEELATALFDRLAKKPEKAAFALDLLYIEDIKVLRAPPYIDAGLTWLASRLKGGEGAI
ncbi:ATP-dependent nuclease [Albimonas pacifica]|uniref:Predicted ATP-dependent endonuclease of the OLD family, contains P-loop ATPase and TOPRIM domains n=1 Tax=Albimonas pacifica TaxID=1114924 RepID=A0A1I3Q0V5_9RHOB|nr:AAA family ATPase [Albimonas pacifica]SFJ27349.1 Predicted ATP-dependent endonuclease of the OLD family, contains P-loop ATPase and TOPRIM domains [Albimonas pacifica]